MLKYTLIVYVLVFIYLASEISCNARKKEKIRKLGKKFKNKIKAIKHKYSKAKHIIFNGHGVNRSNRKDNIHIKIKAQKGINRIENLIMSVFESVNVTFNSVIKKFVPTKSKKHVIGGFEQNTVDAEDVERSKFEKASQFFKNLQDEMLYISLNITKELSEKNFNELTKHKRVSMILMENLATMHSLDAVRKYQSTLKKYTLEWYASAKLHEKFSTVKAIEKMANQISPFQDKKKVSTSNKKINSTVRNLEVELSVQKFVSEIIKLNKFLEEIDPKDKNYMAPFHTNVCGQIGNISLSYLFEKEYKNALNKNLSFFAQHCPYLKLRIDSMIQNGTLLLLEPKLDQAIYDFKHKVSNLMIKGFGFNDMCSKKCFLETISANYTLESYDMIFKETNTLQRRADLTKIIMYYYRDVLFSIETTAEFIIIMLLYINSATELTDKGLLNISTLNTSDEHNLMNITINQNDQKDKFGNIKFKKMAPFNFFREEHEEEYGNEPIFALDDIIKTCLIAKRSKKFDSLYELTKNLWVNIQNIYSASYGFVESKKIKASKFIASKIKNVGFLFRWFSTDMSKSSKRNFLVNQFSPFLSISMQLTFFITTMIEQYESSFLSSFSAALKKIFTLSKHGSNPRNYDDLIKFSETNYLLNYEKGQSVQRIITNIVTILKKKFLQMPYTPSLLAQFISIYLSLWVFENETEISLQNPNVSRFKKLFFLTYFVHNSGPLEKAVEIIYDKCKKKTKYIVLGCIDDYGGYNKKKFWGLIDRSCKPVKIEIKKYSIRKILKTLMPSLSDPLDLLKIAVDTATRCKHFDRAPKIFINDKKQKINKINFDVFVKSELSLRYICASVTKKIVRKAIRDITRLPDMSQAQDLINEIINNIQYLKIKNYKDSESSITIICPFMEDNNQNIRDLERSQIFYFIYSKINLLKIFKGKIANVFKKSINVKKGFKSNSPIFIKVGARKFNGLLYTGGYHINIENDKYNVIHIDMSKSRKVYNGKVFVDEIEIMKSYGVKKIIINGIDKENERMYVLNDNSTVTEFEFATIYPENDIIVFDGHNYISAFALKDMGIDNERLVWAGNSIGWVAEFALLTISATPIPIFDGNVWILLEKLSIKNILGRFLPRDVDGNLLASTVNFIILNMHGKEIMRNATPTIDLKRATFTLSGITNFITKAVQGKNKEIIVYTRLP